MPELPAGSGDIANTPPAVEAPKPAEDAAAKAAAEDAAKKAADDAAAKKAADEAAAKAAADAAAKKAADEAAAKAADDAAKKAAEEAARQPKPYTIVRGDSLWKIAVAHFGDGMKWHEIAAANPGMRKPYILTIGATLLLPPAG